MLFGWTHHNWRRRRYLKSVLSCVSAVRRVPRGDGRCDRAARRHGAPQAELERAEGASGCAAKLDYTWRAAADRRHIFCVLRRQVRQRMLFRCALVAACLVTKPRLLERERSKVVTVKTKIRVVDRSLTGLRVRVRVLAMS